MIFFLSEEQFMCLCHYTILGNLGLSYKNLQTKQWSNPSQTQIHLDDTLNVLLFWQKLIIVQAR